jgi:hypothetical protein
MQALAYLPFPFLVWVALSRGLPAAALSVLLVVFTAAAFTSRGCGPFVSNSMVGTIWQIEAFIAIVATTGLLIAAGAESQRREKVLQALAAHKTAELERLKAQVNPHFLFNCLSAPRCPEAVRGGRQVVRDCFGQRCEVVERHYWEHVVLHIILHIPIEEPDEQTRV